MQKLINYCQKFLLSNHIKLILILISLSLTSALLIIPNNNLTDIVLISPEVPCDYIEIINTQKTKINNLVEINNNLINELEQISNKSVEVYTIPEGHNYFKSYMNYKMLNKDYEGRKLVELGYSDNYGFRRIDELYCVALGSYYGTIGDIFRVTLSTGTQIKVIKCDIKSDSHTDPTNRYTVSSDCMMEFIVDTSSMPESIKISGTVNTGTELDGYIISIYKEDNFYN